MSDKRQSTPPASRFEAFYGRGTELLHEGKARSAVPLLEKAHELDPQHADAAINLSSAYILTKKFRLAVMVLEDVSESYPENIMIWTNLGAAYLGNPVLASDKEQLKAIGAFNRALAIDEQAPNIAYNIGLIFRDRQENEEAIAWFTKALVANPKDKDARTLIKKLQATADASDRTELE